MIARTSMKMFRENRNYKNNKEYTLFLFIILDYRSLSFKPLFKNHKTQVVVSSGYLNFLNMKILFVSLTTRVMKILASIQKV